MTLLAPLLSLGAEKPVDTRKVVFTDQQQKIIDEKCVACHNRKRIDDAVSSRWNMEKVLQRMEKKGVSLSDSERRVMGIFGAETPFRENAESRP